MLFGWFRRKPLPRSKGSKKINWHGDFTKPTKRALGSPAKGARVKSRRAR